MFVRIRYESHGIVEKTAIYAVSSLSHGILIVRTVTRKQILYVSSLVNRGRYNNVSKIAGGIVYLTCLSHLVSS
jgi:hypothetical protein